MKILIAATCACMLAMLSGCALYTPGVAVVVDPPVKQVPAEPGRFCPPGQAKKGRC